jgi:hypothetical protein
MFFYFAECNALSGFVLIMNEVVCVPMSMCYLLTFHFIYLAFNLRIMNITLSISLDATETYDAQSPSGSSLAASYSRES